MSATVMASVGGAELLFVLVAVGLLWFLPAYFAARLAQRKGRSFGLWLAGALIINWVPFLIAALIIRPRGTAGGAAPPAAA